MNTNQIKELISELPEGTLTQEEINEMNMWVTGREIKDLNLSIELRRYIEHSTSNIEIKFKDRIVKSMDDPDKMANLMLEMIKEIAESTFKIFELDLKNEFENILKNEYGVVDIELYLSIARKLIKYSEDLLKETLNEINHKGDK